MTTNELMKKLKEAYDQAQQYAENYPDPFYDNQVRELIRKRHFVYQLSVILDELGLDELGILA